ncbi:MAG: hypothetical protein ACKPKO_07750, partial [Candidatus Fonsibacter sp.]
MKSSVVDLPTLNVLDHFAVRHLFGRWTREIKHGFGSIYGKNAIATPIGCQKLLVRSQCCIATRSCVLLLAFCIRLRRWFAVWPSLRSGGLGGMIRTQWPSEAMRPQTKIWDAITPRGASTRL